MPILTKNSLSSLMAHNKKLSEQEEKRAEIWIEPLNAAMDRYQINTPMRVAAFLAQVLHESAFLSRMVENLNYGASGLMATWPKRFPTLELAKKVERKPESIANHVYGDRMGNTEPGDGWKYRGRGPIQITGKDNYTLCGKGIGFDLISQPELLEQPETGALSAGWFWHKNGLNKIADTGDMVGLTKRINGGTNGIHERLELYDVACKLLGVVK